MNVFRVSIEEALASLGSGPDGLSAAEAARRLREFGPNRIERVRGESVLHRLLKSFTHFFAMLLWVAAGIALFAEWSQPGQGMGTLAVAIVGVILINGLFGFWQEYKAERTLAALARLLPVVVKTVRNGTVALIPSEEVVPGDLLVLAQGDNIPADCRLIEAFGARVNTATVTGESRPSGRSADPYHRMIVSTEGAARLCEVLDLWRGAYTCPDDIFDRVSVIVYDHEASLHTKIDKWGVLIHDLRGTSYFIIKHSDGRKTALLYLLGEPFAEDFTAPEDAIMITGAMESNEVCTRLEQLFNHRWAVLDNCGTKKYHHQPLTHLCTKYAVPQNEEGLKEPGDAAPY